MTYDEFSRYPWLDHYKTVPEVLRPALRLAGRERLCNILDALGEELGLRMDNAGEATYRALDTLVDPLVAALEQGGYFLDTRHIGMAKAVAAALNLNEAHAAMIQLGWGKDRTGPCEIRSLEADVREKLVQRLIPAIQRMMLRWGRRGYFDIAS